jgi:hypothetical protein
MPLFLAIESSIVRFNQARLSLTDADVTLALNRLGVNPEADPGNDPLARHIQRELQLLLSVSDYSRQDVRSAIRKIAKSVSRHTRLAGPFGYLTFIKDFVTP